MKIKMCEINNMIWTAVICKKTDVEDVMIMKKGLSVLLAIVIVFTGVQAGVVTASADQSGDWTYTISIDVTYSEHAKITKYSGSASAVAIPDTLGGYDVEQVTADAFAGCTNLNSITISEHIFSMGESAVSSIFTECTALSNISVVSGNEIYSSQNGVLFDKTKETLIRCPVGKAGNYVIPDSVISVYDWSFFNCANITGITFGRNVEGFGNYAFSGLSKLAAVAAHADNETYSSQDGVLFNDGMNAIVMYPYGKIGHYIVPDGVTELGSFGGCPGLTGVTMPSSVKTIGDGAFSNCTGLLYSDIPDSVTSIGIGAFFNCSKLSSITVPDSVTEILMNAFNNCANLTDVTIGSGVRTIGNSAFRSCLKLENLIIEDGVLTIEEYAFHACTALKFVNIPNSVTSIGNQAFAACSALTGLIIGDSVTSIDDQAFFGCVGLVDVNLGSSVDTIHMKAFSGCSNLQRIVIPASVTLMESEAFSNCTKLQGAYFLGSAPGMLPLVFKSCSAQFKVYYLSSSTGFTTPVWNGYPCVVFSLLTTPVLEAFPTVSTSGDVTVSISFPASATQKQYRLSGGEWTFYTAPIVLKNNDTVFARCKDAPGNISETGSLVVSNIIKTVARTNTSTVINKINSYIYGLTTGLTKSVFENSFVKISGDAKFEYTPDSNTLGTGTVVKLINNSTDELMETFTIVIFGDINGDGSYDSLDAGTAVDYENYMLNWDPAVDAAYLKAGDLNGDGEIDSLDAGKMVDAENYLVTVDQTTGSTV
jgi:hypothetical protein